MSHRRDLRVSPLRRARGRGLREPSSAAHRPARRHRRRGRRRGRRRPSPTTTTSWRCRRRATRGGRRGRRPTTWASPSARRCRRRRRRGAGGARAARRRRRQRPAATPTGLRGGAATPTNSSRQIWGGPRSGFRAQRPTVRAELLRAARCPPSRVVVARRTRGRPWRPPGATAYRDRTRTAPRSRLRRRAGRPRCLEALGRCLQRGDAGRRDGLRDGADDREEVGLLHRRAPPPDGGATAGPPGRRSKKTTGGAPRRRPRRGAPTRRASQRRARGRGCGTAPGRSSRAASRARQGRL
mmetsp:Transcript_13259/g.53165  ORF Transcript_13259/g.53165 Transcript_13259/m.53165 type:complete len:297 (-) Transcript_13259:193-1083(-)